MRELKCQRASCTHTQVASLCHYNSLILVFHEIVKDEKKKKSCEFIDNVLTFNNVKYCQLYTVSKAYFGTLKLNVLLITGSYNVFFSEKSISEK